jgi:hypothetical protein
VRIERFDLESASTWISSSVLVGSSCAGLPRNFVNLDFIFSFGGILMRWLATELRQPGFHLQFWWDPHALACHGTSSTWISSSVLVESSRAGLPLNSGRPGRCLSFGGTCKRWRDAQFLDGPRRRSLHTQFLDDLPLLQVCITWPTCQLSCDSCCIFFGPLHAFPVANNLTFVSVFRNIG